MRLYGAPLPLLREQTETRSAGSANRKENLTLARKFRSENAKTWLFENLDLDEMRAARATISVVMRGLDPRIHFGFRERWMAGSSPAMTKKNVEPKPGHD